MVTMHRLSKVLVALAAMMGQVESIGLTQGDGKMGKANTTMPSMLLEGQRSTMRREGKTAAEFSINVGTFNDQPPGHEAITTCSLYSAQITTHTKWDADDVIGYMRGVFWNDDPDGLLFEDETLAWDDEDEHSYGTAWYCTFLQCNGPYQPAARYGVIPMGGDGLERDDDLRNALVSGCAGADVDFQIRTDGPTYPDTMLCRTHFFDLQFLHAMASESCKCPAQVRVAIYHWAEFTFNTARGNIEYYYDPVEDTYTLKGFDACSKIEENSVGGTGGQSGIFTAWTSTPVINVGSLRLGGIVQKGVIYTTGGSSEGMSKGLCSTQSTETSSDCSLIMLFRSPTDEANICATTCRSSGGTGRPLLYNECDWTGSASDCNRPGMWLDPEGDCSGAESCMCGGIDTTRRRWYDYNRRRRDDKNAYTATAKSSCVKCDDHDGGIRLNTRQRGAGSLIHMIQDSYSAAHTVRIDGSETACKYTTSSITSEGKKNCGLLVQISNYDGQDAFGDTHKFYDCLDEHPDNTDIDLDDLYDMYWSGDASIIGHSPGNVQGYGASVEVLRAAFTMDGVYQRNTYGYQRRRFGQAFRLQLLPGYQVIDVPTGSDRVTLEYKLATDIFLLNDPDNNNPQCDKANVASGSWNSDVTSLQAWVRSKCQIVSGPGIFRHSDAWQPRQHDMGTLVSWVRTPVTIANQIEYNCDKTCPCDNSDDYCPDTNGRIGADPYAR